MYKIYDIYSKIFDIFGILFFELFCFFLFQMPIKDTEFWLHYVFNHSPVPWIYSKIHSYIF